MDWPEVWPVSVPVLTATDICKGSFDGPNGEHCLSGWCDITFGHTYRTFVDARRAIREEAGLGEHDIISDFNDSHQESEVADVFNRAMRRLGYTEILEPIP